MEGKITNLSEKRLNIIRIIIIIFGGIAFFTIYVVWNLYKDSGSGDIMLTRSYLWRLLLWGVIQALSFIALWIILHFTYIKRKLSKNRDTTNESDVILRAIEFLDSINNFPF